MIRKDFTGKNREKFESMVSTVANCNSHDYKKQHMKLMSLLRMWMQAKSLHTTPGGAASGFWDRGSGVCEFMRWLSCFAKN